jgi:filamentous hemagglutinin family protein
MGLPGALCLLACLCDPVRAGVATDGTLGPAATVLAGPNYDISAGLGQQQGGNLFHSFSVFDIASGESANFSGPATITNIISRVTGGTVSTVDGAINSSIAGASLFLINPDGIMFGPGASLNVSGSFHASTASYLVLGTSGRFDAVTPGNSVLISAPPAAFGFLGTPAGISVTDTRLQAANGQTLSLVGGDITTQNALLYAPEGTVQVASLGAAGEVGVDVSTLDPGSYGKMGTINVSHPGSVAARFVPGVGFVGNLDASGDDGGTVVIRGGNIMLDSALVFADSNLGSSGRVDIKAADQLHATNGATVSADHFGTGPGGVVTVEAGEVILDKGGRLQADNYTSNPGGRIQVTAGTVTIEEKSDPAIALVGDQESGLFAAAFDSGGGGDVTVDATTVSVGGGGAIELNADTAGGDGGNLSVTADLVQLHDDGAVRVNTFGSGDAGDVTLTVDRLEITSGGSIATQSLGAGTAGTIDITATSRVSVSGTGSVDPSGIYSNAFSTGNGGRIAVSAPDISFDNGARIQAGVGVSQSAGGLPPATAATQAGSISLQGERVTVSGQAQVSTQSDNAGQAGDIEVQADEALVINSPAGAVQSGLFSSAAGTGAGGNIVIRGGVLMMDGGAINVSSATAGDAGTISTTLDSAALQNGAQISTSVGGTGDGGVLSVSASGDVTLDGRASDGFRTGIYSQSGGSGAGGAVLVDAGNVSLHDGATINSESLGSGDAGDITVTAVNSVDMINASITTAAVNADGGNIKVTASDRVYLKNSDVTAAVGGGLGNGGNVDIDPQFVVLSNSNVLASAIGGNGGNITIVADHFVSSPDSVLNASSQLGISGTISILSPDEEINSNQVELPVAYLDAAALLKERCSARHLGDQSSFIVAGRTALPVAPDSPYSLLSGIADSAGPVTTGGQTSLQQQWLSNTLAASRYGCTL